MALFLPIPSKRCRWQEFCKAIDCPGVTGFRINGYFSRSTVKKQPRRFIVKEGLAFGV